jgi:hypothetical protein
MAAGIDFLMLLFLCGMALVTGLATIFVFADLAARELFYHNQHPFFDDISIVITVNTQEEITVLAAIAGLTAFLVLLVGSILADLIRWGKKL